jgi:hypothetical protein
MRKTCIIHAMFETASWCTKTTKFMSRTVSAVFIACASLLVCSATLIYYYLEKIKQKNFCIDGNFQRKFIHFLDLITRSSCKIIHLLQILYDGTFSKQGAK